MLERMVFDGVDVSEGAASRVDQVGQLLQRVARGDRGAFARVYDLVAPRAFGIIVAELGDRTSGEAVLEEVFLEVWRSATRFDADLGDGRSWVLAIARRRAVERRGGDGMDAAAAPARGATVADEAPPLTLRSSLLSATAAMPQLPSLDAAVAAEAAPGTPWVAPELEPEAEPARDAAPAPFVEPAPTTTTIQAVQRRNWTRAIILLAVALVLLVAVGFVAATINEYVNRPPEVVTLQQIQQAPDGQSTAAEIRDGGIATVHWSASLGEAVLVATGLPELAGDQTFELWLVRGGEPISAGTFEADAQGGATVLLDDALEPGDTIAVTIEDQSSEADDPPAFDPIVEIPTT
jgi:DNA-directed RNA polymerase specialized sigma24 family protein